MLSRKAFFKLIKENEHEALKEVIADNIDYFFSAKPKSGSALHCAARFGDIETFSIILNHLKKINRLDEALKLVDGDGLTVLHSLVKFNKGDVIRWVVSELKEKMPGLAKMRNNRGILPVDSFGRGYDPSLIDFLSDITYQNILAPFSEPLDEKAILSEFKNEDEETLRLVKIACSAVNKTRKRMICTNHPSQILDAEKDMEVKDARQDLRNEENLHVHVASIEKTGGRCEEAAYMTAYYAISEDNNLVIETMGTDEGDHFVLLFRRALGSDPMDVTTYGDNAFICDPWAGKIFSIKRMKECFATFAYYELEDGSEATTTFGYNPVYHDDVSVVRSFKMDPNTRQIKLSYSPRLDDVIVYPDRPKYDPRIFGGQLPSWVKQAIIQEKSHSPAL